VGAPKDTMDQTLINFLLLEKAAASFFTPLSQKKPEPIKWRILGTSLVIGRYTPEGYIQNFPEKNRKIAAFDLVSAVEQISFMSC
jgi:bifunctional polynucleotide phosphatase/kinase